MGGMLLAGAPALYFPCFLLTLPLDRLDRRTAKEAPPLPADRALLSWYKLAALIDDRVERRHTHAQQIGGLAHGEQIVVGHCITPFTKVYNLGGVYRVYKGLSRHAKPRRLMIYGALSVSSALKLSSSL